MIMRDDPKVVKRVCKRELSEYCRKRKLLFKPTQIKFNELRSIKDRFEWNEFKRKTISFEQICQIRNMNRLFARQKWDVRDRRIVVPEINTLYGIQNNIVSAIVKGYIKTNVNK